MGTFEYTDMTLKRLKKVGQYNKEHTDNNYDALYEVRPALDLINRL
jgi:hypothetical protein